MKWSHFFLVVFLIPILVYEKSNEKTYNEIYFKIAPEWERHTELLEDFQRLDSSNEEARLHVLHEAIECCRRAIHHCDVILKHIADKPKSKQKKQWRVNMKKGCERGKSDFNAEIGDCAKINYRT